MFNHCEKCWDNPCECGHEYRHFCERRLRALIAILEKMADAERDK